MLAEFRFSGTRPSAQTLRWSVFSKAHGAPPLADGERQRPPWGTPLKRQAVYNLGGGPAGYARAEQLAELPDELRGWAVRFEAGATAF